MNARTVILLVVVVILGIILYSKWSAEPAKVTEVSNEEEGIYEDQELTDEELADIRLLQTVLAKRDLAGEEPADPPELSIRVEVDRSSGKNTLCAYITEAHGYYVESFRIRFWYKGGDEYPDPESSPLKVTHYANAYVKANDTLKECIQVVPAELNQIGGDIGTSEDWDAEITMHGRARLENPDPLPPL